MPSDYNPYSNLINMIKDYGASYNPPSIEIGQVLSDSPLTIKLGDLQLNSSNLLISDHLVKEYKREIDETIKCSGYNDICSRVEHINGSPLDEIKCKLTVKYNDKLKSGDLVAMLSTYDRQKFIVIARVVTI